MNTRRVILKGLTVRASIGMLDHERQSPQPLIIDAQFDTDASGVIDDTDIGSVLDYRLLRTALTQEATREHIDLLETLVDKSLDRILQDFPLVLQVTLRICKPQAFHDCEAVCIEQSRRR